MAEWIDSSFGRRTLHKTERISEVNLYDHPTLYNLFHVCTAYFSQVEVDHRKRTLRIKLVDVACTCPYGFDFEYSRFFLFAYEIG